MRGEIEDRGGIRGGKKIMGINGDGGGGMFNVGD